jgi:hypothetical protein
MMVKLDLKRDPTLEAADSALEAIEVQRANRTYLGISGIGDCARKSYYRLHMVEEEPFGADTLKNFADGHRTEDLVIERIRRVPGITLIDRDPETGKQLEVSDLNGHFLGHLDGEILGLIQAPKTWHVFEVKCTNDQGFAKFCKLKYDIGDEKQVLKAWNETYYAQAQCYMHYRGHKRHYMVVASAGGRRWESIRTNYSRKAAEWYVDRAHQIIQEPHIMPARISDNPGNWVCKQFCGFHSVCHEGATPTRTCRTCCWSEAVEHGDWFCHRHQKILSTSEQRAGCPDQRFRGAYVPGIVLETNETTNTVIYRLNNGERWEDKGARDDESISTQ